MLTVPILLPEEARPDQVRDAIQNELDQRGKGTYKFVILGGGEGLLIPYDAKTTRLEASPDGHIIYYYDPDPVTQAAPTGDGSSPTSVIKRVWSWLFA